MAIDWGRGYEATWHVYRVSRDTWADASELTGVTEVSVESSCDNEPLIQKGSLSVDVAPGTAFEEDYYRVVMVATQGAYQERVELATLLCSSSEGEVNRGVDSVQIQGRSVLYPASRTQLETGSYAPSGVNGVAYCADLLRACTNAPVETQGSFTLDDHLVFDAGSYVLDAVWGVLEAGSYVIEIEGDGTIMIMPKPTEPSLVLDDAGARLVHPGIRHSMDYSEVPNRYYANENGVEEMAVNDDRSSVTSTTHRGWFSDQRDDSPTRVNGETLHAYCERMLEEASTVTDERTYSREWWPGVHPFDVVRGTLSSVGLDGDLRVVSQSVTCGRGVTVEERSNREVHTWQR